ncbi:serine/threonine-protein kinase [Catellatospora sp. KI3]|uniref:serine/threonine-protein kinase n=1 Tax=Catellatospora sp. KI3 TaxID=3041620 RepID=UPI0024830203|nr:serine/threonine-protein kinase [Catellatospora sp. KI3]MDI1460106.1 serine/threonine-protein kinase [Catellatospora sp. KI3]
MNMPMWTVPGYTEVRELGRGASGLVVLAQHDATGVKVAIKYLAEHLRGDEEFIRAFRAEARIMSEVDSPEVARLYEYVESPGGAAIVMELVEGVALRAILREQGPTEPQAALVVLKGSLLGLAAAHARGVVHRDYKPENVLVDGNGQSKLADFGIAARSGRQGPLAGTPSYMAPEQWAGAAASPSTDIYAATATFFECLVGRPPFRAPGDLAGLRRQHEQAPVPTDDVPEAVRGLVRRGLAKDPRQRPRDADTFLHELEAVAGAGYGPDWEEDGRGKLARRALLLALLFPLAGMQADASAVATTILGMSKRAFWVLTACVTVLVLGAGGAAGVALMGDPKPPAPAVSSPSPSPLPSPTPSSEPSPSPSPSAEPSPSPSESPEPSPSPSKKPSPKPSPSPSPTIPIAPVDSLARPSLCWWYKEQCFQDAIGTEVRAAVLVKLANPGKYTLTLRFAVTNSDGTELTQYTPKLVIVPVVSEETSTTFNHVVNLSGMTLPCNTYLEMSIRSQYGGPVIPTKLYPAPIIPNQGCIIG